MISRFSTDRGELLPRIRPGRGGVRPEAIRDSDELTRSAAADRWLRRLVRFLFFPGVVLAEVTPYLHQLPLAGIGW